VLAALLRESAVERDLTDATAADSARDGRANRRSFTSEEKLAIVLESEQLGNSVAAVARAHRLATSALFRWRAEFGYGRKSKAELAPVVVSSEQTTDKTKAHPAAPALQVLP
jgi:transposase-like protein